LVLYGGYNELADILINLTSLATEMGRLVSCHGKRSMTE
jgi:hypothetical protein